MQFTGWGEKVFFVFGLLPIVLNMLYLLNVKSLEVLAGNNILARLTATKEYLPLSTSSKNVNYLLLPDIPNSLPYPQTYPEQGLLARPDFDHQD